MPAYTNATQLIPELFRVIVAPSPQDGRQDIIAGDSFANCASNSSRLGACHEGMTAILC